MKAGENGETLRCPEALGMAMIADSGHVSRESAEEAALAGLRTGFGEPSLRVADKLKLGTVEVAVRRIEFDSGDPQAPRLTWLYLREGPDGIRTAICMPVLWAEEPRRVCEQMMPALEKIQAARLVSARGDSASAIRVRGRELRMPDGCELIGARAVDCPLALLTVEEETGMVVPIENMVQALEASLRRHAERVSHRTVACVIEGTPTQCWLFLLEDAGKDPRRILMGQVSSDTHPTLSVRCSSQVPLENQIPPPCDQVIALP